MTSVQADPRRGDKPELVLLAGLLCDRSFWSGVASELEDLAQITVFEFAGFSSIEAMAKHVISEAPKRFILVGHSLGGRVALEIIRRAPARVRALGLLNTGVHPTAGHEPKSRGELVHVAQTQGMRALAQRWLPPMMDSGGNTSLELMERLTAMVERASPSSYEGQVSALLNRPDAAPVLPSIGVPTLLMSASGDSWSPVAQHEEIRKRVPHADLVVIDRAGHMAPAEQPHAVAARLREWIESLGDEDLDDVRRSAIEASCSRQIIRYARLNDAGDFEAIALLYTPDAVFSRPSEPEVHIRGRPAILAALQARVPRTTRHVMTNIEVVVDSSTRARARSTVLLFVGEAQSFPAPIKGTLVGTFDDILEAHGHDLLFAQRLGALQMKS